MKPVFTIVKERVWMKAPCEKILWYILPAIRKELVRSIVKEYGHNQRTAARLLGLSDAAVSQYLSKKRGRVQIMDKKVLAEISKAAKRIIDTKERVEQEICGLCTLIRSSRVMKDLP